MNSPHVIRQQTLQVNLLGSEQQGLQLQARLSAYCRDWLNPALERLFEQMAPDGEYMQIDRLSLDLGTLSLADWEDNLTAAVIEQLRTRLKVIDADPADRRNNRHTGAANSVVRLPPQQYLFDAWLGFLQTGLLAWSVRLTPGQTLQSRIATLFENPAGMTTYQRQQLQQTLRQPSAMQRLHLQFDSRTRALLLQRLAPELSAALLEIAGEVESTLLMSMQSAADRQAQSIDSEAPQQLLQAMLQQTAVSERLFTQCLASSPHVAQDWRPFLRNLFKTVALQAMAMPTTAAPLKQKTQFTASKNSSELPDIEFARLTTDNSPIGASKIRQNQLEKDIPLPAANKSESTDSGKRQATFDRYDSSQIAESLSEGIYLDNAGLVLLHPFLPQLFAALAIANDQSIEQPERALQLLHFLATGHATAPEYELPLAKLLLGLPLTQSFATLTPLDESAQEEAIALLNAVIKHWRILRDTSPDGLRGTFLLRPGKLSLREDGNWLLQVEQQGFDILLNQLPWGFSMIKLPWMSNMLLVEWSY